MRAVGLITCGVLCACAELPALEHGVCGNGVVESGEDCDGSVDTALGENLACAACRYTCSEALCPTGWGCADDDVCRYGSGEFDIGLAIPLPHNDYSIGDVDGVRGGEIIATGAGARVAMHDRVTVLSAADALARPTVAGDVNGDGRVDVVAAVGAGIGIWRGELDGTLSAIGYAPFAVERRAWILPARVPRVGAPDPNPDALFLLEPRVEGLHVELLLATTVGKLPIAGAPNPEHLGRVAVRADFDAPSTADELVFVARGKSEAWFIEPRQDATSGFASGSLTLPEPSDGRVAVGDVDADGDLDLLFGTETPSGFELHVAFNGPQSFAFADTTVFDRLAEPNANPGVSSAPRRPFPLAVGDLDGDSKLDAVSPDAVFKLDPASGVLEPVFRRFTPNPWDEAIITNLDQDERDVVVVDGTRLTVLRQGGGTFTSIAIDTVGSVSNLRAGDFDGDGYGDVLFREATTDGEAIRVLYGSDSALGAPMTVLRAPSVPRIEVGRISGAGVYDAADEIFAVLEDGIATPENPNVSRAAVISGAGDRRMTSPLLLTTGAGFDFAVGAVPGHFRRERGVGTDLVVLGARGGEAFVWLFDAGKTVGAAFTSANAGTQRVRELEGFRTQRLAAADQHGDGTDDVLVFGVSAQGPTQLLAIDFDVIGPPVTIAFTLSIGNPQDLAVGDLDLDGRADVVAVGSTGVSVLGRPELSEVGTVRSACIAQLDRDPQPELVLLELGEIAIYDGVTLALQGRVASPVGTLVRAGDLDGDGVADLVVGDELGVTPMYARPQLPR